MIENICKKYRVKIARVSQYRRDRIAKENKIRAKTIYDVVMNHCTDIEEPDFLSAIEIAEYKVIKKMGCIRYLYTSKDGRTQNKKKLVQHPEKPEEPEKEERDEVIGEFKIDKGIPIPEPQCKRSKWKDRLEKMISMDSFICNEKESNLAYMHARALKIKITIRKLGLDKFRVWRIS